MNNNQRFERTCYLYLHSRKCVIGVLTRLRVGHSGFRIPAKARYFYYLLFVLSLGPN